MLPTGEFIITAIVGAGVVGIMCTLFGMMIGKIAIWWKGRTNGREF